MLQFLLAGHPAEAHDIEDLAERASTRLFDIETRRVTSQLTDIRNGRTFDNPSRRTVRLLRQEERARRKHDRLAALLWADMYDDLFSADI